MKVHYNGIAIMDAQGTGGHFAHCGKKLNGTGDETSHWEDKNVNCPDCLHKVYRSKLFDDYGAYYQMLNGNRIGLGAEWAKLDKLSTDEIALEVEAIKQKAGR